MSSPNAMSLEECRRRGWTAGVVEQTIPKTFIKRDFLGCIDIIAATPEGIVGIQATSNNGGNHSARVAKIKAEPRMAEWLKSGARLLVWSWAKQGPRGARKTWTLREEAISL